jgi:predicted nuclease of predicted toxin-antitoxin system
MRLLANENFPGDAVSALRNRGHDVFWVRTQAPGSSDQEVLARAVREDRVLLTFDKDFGELAFRSRLPAECGIVLFRIPTSSPAYVSQTAVAALEADVDWAGHFVVVEERRLRIAPLPSSAGGE